MYDNLFAENYIVKSNKIQNSDCDTSYYIIGEFRVEKIIKLQNGMYLIYLTNSTRDKIYTVISIKNSNKKINKLFTKCEKITEGEIYNFRLDYFIPYCIDEVVIGDKYISGNYVVDDKKIFLPKEIIKGDLFFSHNLNAIYYINLINTDKK